MARSLSAPGRLRRKEAAGCGDPATAGPNPKPITASDCRSHRTLCRRQAGKRQHRHLQLRTLDHRDRFKNRPHQTDLQEDEGRKIRRENSRLSRSRETRAPFGRLIYPSVKLSPRSWRGRSCRRRPRTKFGIPRLRTLARCCL